MEIRSARAACAVLTVVGWLICGASTSIHGATLTTLHSFIPGNIPSGPEAGLVLDTDGNFYGTSYSGGILDPGGGNGTIYKVTPTGQVTVIHQFNGYSDGYEPECRLAVDPTTGNLYGTTVYGGQYGYGTVFMITPGDAFTTLHSFNQTDGQGPSNGLLYQGGDFYGTTVQGGANGDGAIYKITPAGVFSSVYSLTRSDGSVPTCTMVFDPVQSLFYGTTELGGSSSDGTVFSFASTGIFKTIASFDGTNGEYPFGELTLGLDGNIYGGTAFGGSGYGNVYQVTPSGTITSLHAFTNADGSYPGGGLLEDGKGLFYGTTEFDGANSAGTLFSITSNGIFTELAAFGGSNGNDPVGGLAIKGDLLYGATNGGANCVGTIFSTTTAGDLTTIAKLTYTDGAVPFYSSPIRASDGYFYGTTEFGGAYGLGTVFKMSPAGVTTVIHSFDGVNGKQPVSGLVQGVDGYLYGTTFEGGPGAGDGTAFKISTTGVFTRLHVFQANVDGIYPIGTLLLGAGNDFYGTTEADGPGSNGKGAVFEMTPTGVVTVLHTFTGVDGNGCNSGLIDGQKGYYYGATMYGGANGLGNIFRITPDGKTFQNLYSFTGGADGEMPIAAPTLASDGYFYGMSTYGSKYLDGEVYKMAPDGTPIKFIAPLDNNTTGYNGGDAFVQGVDGLLYATNTSGGALGNGAVFAISTSGEITTVHSFTGADGNGPNSNLIQTAPGVFYSTTSAGGTQSGGTVFRLAVPPTAPSKLTATYVDNKVVLKWTGGVGQTSYNVYRGVKSGGEHSTPFANLTGATFTDTAVVDGNVYYYTVAGVNGAGPGAMSNEASVSLITSAATFVKTDAKTQGSWKGIYGVDGFDIIDDKSNNNPTIPTYAILGASGATSVLWAASSTEPYALEAAAKGSTLRLLGADYAAGSFSFHIDLKDGQTHPIEIYLVDWLNKRRTETITFADAVNGGVLNQQTASGFANGVYYDYNVKGDVILRISLEAGPNAVASALFFK